MKYKILKVSLFDISEIKCFIYDKDFCITNILRSSNNLISKLNNKNIITQRIQDLSEMSGDYIKNVIICNNSDKSLSC